MLSLPFNKEEECPIFSGAIKNLHKIQIPRVNVLSFIGWTMMCLDLERNGVSCNNNSGPHLC